MRKYSICRELGRRIVRFRKERGLSQEELADLAGLHRTYIGKIERGESNPPVYTVYRIAKTLKVKLSELF